MKLYFLKILPFVWLILLIDTNLIAMHNNYTPDKGELRKSLEQNIQVKLKFIISNRNQMNSEETQKKLQILKKKVEQMLEEVTPFSVSMAERISNIQDSIEDAMEQ